MNNPTIEDLKKCIEEGHDYSDEPTCNRCGHYGPGDREHQLQLKIQELQNLQPFLMLSVTSDEKIECTHAVDAIDNPAKWGIIIADTVRHIARARTQLFTKESEWANIDIIQKIFNDEIRMQRIDPDRGGLIGGIVQ